ncbi:hypothetical protein [Ralstonia phage RP13]|nr:hypothetical protein [Ralstonia phage RP13]
MRDIVICRQADKRVDEKTVCQLVAVLFEDHYLVDNLLHTFDRKATKIRRCDYKIYTEMSINSGRVDIVLEFDDTAVFIEAKRTTISASEQMSRYCKNTKYHDVIGIQLVLFDEQVKILKYLEPDLNIISVESLLEQIDNSNTVAKVLRPIVKRATPPSYEEWLDNHLHQLRLKEQYSADKNIHKPEHPLIKFYNIED